MDVYLAGLPVIIVFSAVQSVFGVGLLVFGTPSLLLLGFSFADALSWLLPASVAISTVQILDSPKEAKRLYVSALPFYCFIPLAAALVLVLTTDLRVQMNFAIGVTMLVAAAVRFDRNLYRIARQLVLVAQRPFLVAMGLLHGFTDMGGTLLTIYASSLHESKDRIRETIARYYLAFGLIQLSVLVSLKAEVIGYHSLLAAMTAAVVYYVIGRRVFRRASSKAYQQAVTVLIALYGTVFIVKTSL